MSQTKSSSHVRIHRTQKFSVIGTSGDDCNVKNGIFAEQAEKSADPIRMGIFLDIDEPYTRQLIERAFARPSRAYHFQITLGPGVGMDPVPLPSHCAFQWSEYERIDWHGGVLPGKHCASSYCIRKGISRKAQLAHYTHRHVCKNPESILIDAMPQTVVLDCWPVWEDDAKMTNQGGLADVVVSIGSAGGDSSTKNRRYRLDQCLAEAKTAMDAAEIEFETGVGGTSAPIWILKGSTTNKGVGIYIVHLYEQVVDHCWSDSDIREWVLQRYIATPLLLGKRKFHIRAYALAVSALRVYLYRDCLALCSGSRYRQDDTTNLGAHITNTAYQISTDPGFREQRSVLGWSNEDIAPMLLRDGTCGTMNEARDAIQTVIDQMGAITGELFRAYQSEFGVFAPIEGCFEHYGLDFLVDDKWRVYLLEVNPGPDFKQTGSNLESVIENLMGSTIDVALLPKATGKLCDDSGKLSLVYEQSRRAAQAS